MSMLEATAFRSAWRRPSCRQKETAQIPQAFLCHLAIGPGHTGLESLSVRRRLVMPPGIHRAVEAQGQRGRQVRAVPVP